ncbi:MAG: DNA cytosine methyltransferase [Pseudomonadota bacterium]
MMRKLRLLDLFSGAGGTAMGYHRAGFEVVGVDIKPQPHFPFEFHLADALTYPLDGFDVIHASPPCQAHSALKHLHPEKQYECFIGRTRPLLEKTGRPWVIENVPGAPLRIPVMLCGSSFGLRVRRHRLFESSIQFITGLPCDHKTQGRPIDVSGTGGRRINRRPDDHGGNTNKPRSIREAQEAMGIDWMTRYELSQAIPPAYTEFIGRQIINAIVKGKIP